MAFSSADPQAYLALAMQSGLGSPQTAATKFRFGKYISGNSFNNDPTLVDMREGGDGLNFGFTYKRQQKVSGTLVFNARPEILGQFLQIGPGGATWSGASAPAVHTFHDAHASIPYATMQMSHPGSDLLHLFSDVVFTGWTIEAEAGTPLKFTAPYTAITMGASTNLALSPSYASEDPFIYHFGPSYLLDGAADSTIESWRLECRYGVEELQAQSVKLDDVVVQNRDYDFTLVRRYQNASQWAKIAYGGGKIPTQSVPTGSFKAVNQYGTGATLRYLQIDLGLLSYRNDVLTELDPDGRTIKETITAKPLKTASALCVIQLQNGHASAYAS